MGVTRNRALSRPARAVLAELLEARGRWSHGYELSQATGIASGTLYPLLIRLHAQGCLEAEWQPPAVTGRPARHAYRLTAAGVELALAQAGASDGTVSVAGWRAGKAAS